MQSPQKNGAIDYSPHGAFWRVDYATFTTGKVPHVGGISIMNLQTPLQSPFFVILTNPNGFQNRRQMPRGGPFITDAGYQVSLADGTSITGQQIIDSLTEWLSNGFPE